MSNSETEPWNIVLKQIKSKEGADCTSQFILGISIPKILGKRMRPAERSYALKVLGL
jgi:hypothetical protein